MVLLIYHFDKFDNREQFFDSQEIRLDLGFYPKSNTYIKLRQLGYCVNNRGGMIHLDFPDVEGYNVTKEEIDEYDGWEMKGLVFSNRTGENASLKEGQYNGCSEHYDLNINLGTMDTQKDYFSVIVNGRRAAEGGGTDNRLASVSIVLEMSHHNRHT